MAHTSGAVRAYASNDSTKWQRAGNFPPQVSVGACGAEGYPSPADLAAAPWTTLVPRSPVAGDARSDFEVEPGLRATHVRLAIFPDGGVARLRVFGRPAAAARTALAGRFLRLLPEPQLAGLPPSVREQLRLSG